MDKVIPVVVIKDVNDTIPTLKALKEGGINCAEITFRTACAADAIGLGVKEFSDMNIGAGTVIYPCTVLEGNVKIGEDCIIGQNTRIVDSTIGRTAAVMLGSTETTFYTISVYFGAAGIKKTRYCIPAALFADFVGFFMASFTVRIYF